MNAPRQYSEEFRTGYRDFDRQGKFKLKAWFDLLQEAAAAHAQLLGLGFDALQARGNLWVLSRLRLQISGSPEVGRNICVHTWPTQFSRLFANRQFQLFSDNGAELGRASSQWLLLDAANYRPRRIEEIAELLPDNSDLPVWFDCQDRLTLPENLTGDWALEVRPTMEDVNGHLNNAEYAGLVQDFLVSRLRAAHPVQELEIVYHAAVKAPETLLLRGCTGDGGVFSVGGFLDGGKLSFTARGRFHD